MAGSYRRVNYSLRLAKQIERKMLVETLSRLAPFAPVSTYRYVGMGSIYFADFALVHRALGINTMISIEEQVQDRPRIESNRPFACIRVLYGTSTDQLPYLDWSPLTIAWLDYDGRLDRNVLADTAWFFANAVPGSVYIATVNVQDPNPTPPATTLGEITEAVGADRVPSGTTEKDLASWGLSDVCRRIIINEIQDTLNQRNGGEPKGLRLRFRQLFHFRYLDGARMLTVGGVLYQSNQDATLQRCQFGQLKYVRGGKEPYTIDVPNLTYREIRHLDTMLPGRRMRTKMALAIPRKDRRNYSKVYRYFPLFAETQL